MRTRKAIEETHISSTSQNLSIETLQKLTLEVLLDIRDILQNKKT